jgi:fructose-bisphosphate aldolase class II
MAHALDNGFTSICIDIPGAPATEIGDLTARLKDVARGEACVESVIGPLAYSEVSDEGKPGHESRASADDVVRFDKRYGPDFLAFDLGSRHGMSRRELRLDHDLLEDVVSRTRTPVVLHGSSGVLLDEIAWAVSRGVRKVNIETAVRHAAMDAVASFMATDPNRGKPRYLTRRLHETMVPVYTELLHRYSTTPADGFRGSLR